VVKMKPIMKLRNMQHDENLTSKQQKLANELYKKVLLMEEFPDVSDDLVNCAIEMVLNED